MSKSNNRHRRQKLRQAHEVPVMIERVQKAEHNHVSEGVTYVPGKTYEEANWARLSPLFREAHNKLRVARGLTPIPAPAIDLYVKPQAPLIKPYDFNDKEFVSAAREFMGSTLMGGSSEGFTINGRLVK